MSRRLPQPPDALAAVQHALVCWPTVCAPDPSALQRTTGQRGNGALVIAIDEFEELFTQCVEEAERCCFGTLQTLRQADPRHAFASSSS